MIDKKLQLQLMALKNEMPQQDMVGHWCLMFQKPLHQVEPVDALLVINGWSLMSDVIYFWLASSTNNDILLIHKNHNLPLC